VSRVDRLLAYCRPAKASRGEIGELTATRHLGPGGYRGIDQKCEGKNDVLNRDRTISPVMRSPERGIAWCVEGMRMEGC
jgi:hypothetical protein